MRFRLLAETRRFAETTARDADRAFQRAAQKATHRAGVGLQQEVRTVMRGQRLGNLGNAIKLTTDLRKGQVHMTGSGGWTASAFLYASAPSPRTSGALESYLEGRTITPVNGRWLAIATPEIPRRVGRYRMTPRRYVEGGLENRIGPLTFVPGRLPGVAYLVVKDATISESRQGKARRLPKRGGVRPGRARVGFVAFVLIRSTRRTRRLDVRAIAEKWQTRVPRFFLDALEGRG
jgi:hypothetical protein